MSCGGGWEVSARDSEVKHGRPCRCEVGVRSCVTLRSGRRVGRTVRCRTRDVVRDQGPSWLMAFASRGH